DHLGTPQKMTAVNGAVVWSAKYNAFGKAVVDPGSGVENNLRFPGQYYDAETGLYYNFHRYYDAQIGRYLRVDPIGLNGGINFYNYSENDPANSYDPSGLNMIDSYEYFRDGKKPQGFPPDWKPMDNYIPDPNSPMGKCLNKVYSEMKKAMGVTTAVQGACFLKGAVVCSIVGTCSEGVAFGGCMSFVMKRCGIVANVPRIPIIASWLKKRAKCLELPGSYIKKN
ncbi:MAG: hypothetical protein GY865_03505, partial [candidate division Zixibacteria bacterium]|nr:hypothetical protein [candidate division Zixibacteria bacterium]